MYKCENCGRTIESMEDYNKETEDVSNGFEWLVKHKEQYCQNHYRSKESV